MTTDDLIPPPPRVVLAVKEIVLEELGDKTGIWTPEQLRNTAFALSKEFEDVIVSVRINGKLWSYRNGYDFKSNT